MRRVLTVALIALALSGCRSGTSADVNGMPANTAGGAVSLTIRSNTATTGICCVAGAHAMGERPGDWMVMLTLTQAGVAALKQATSATNNSVLSLDGDVLMPLLRPSDLDGDMLTIPNLTQARALALVSQLTHP